MTLNQNVTKRRLELNITKDEVARRAGCSSGIVVKIEKGENVNITLKTLRGLCKALECKPVDLIPENFLDD